jgi:hypothetical protein
MFPTVEFENTCAYASSTVKTAITIDTTVATHRFKRFKIIPTSYGAAIAPSSLGHPVPNA